MTDYSRFYLSGFAYPADVTRLYLYCEDHPVGHIAELPIQPSVADISGPADEHWIDHHQPEER